METTITLAEARLIASHDGYDGPVLWFVSGESFNDSSGGECSFYVITSGPLELPDPKAAFKHVSRGGGDVLASVVLIRDMRLNGDYRATHESFVVDQRKRV